MWKPIETAPRDGRPMPCCWAGHAEWKRLGWKTNSRTNQSYFGDLEESDDYYLADDQPTHWFEFPEPPP